MIARYGRLPEEVGALPRAAGTFCCLLILSGLPPGVLAPAELKVTVALAMLPAPSGWAGGGQGLYPLAALLPVLPEPGPGCPS